MSVLFTRRGAPPVIGKMLSDYAVGESVFLSVGGASREFIVVHQGNPSSLYDESCNGTWLLMKDIYENRQWHSSNVNDYAASTIHSYLNSTFLGLMPADVQKAVKQVKIPYRAGAGGGTAATSGANGLSAKIFLLSFAEVSLNNQNFMPTGEGAELSYFKGCADDWFDDKRVAKFNGSVTNWWLRSPCCGYTVDSSYALFVSSNGSWNSNGCSGSLGIRPALVMPFNALFDPNTNTFKGVA